jgi:hypothetical protein
MRYQGWIVLFAGLFAIPQLTFSADGWGAPMPYMERYAPSAYSSDHPRFRPYPVAVNTAYRPRYPDMRMSGYRFRPWQGPAPSPALQQGGVQPPVTTSYWGGMPAGRHVNAPHSATTYSMPAASTGTSSRQPASPMPYPARQAYADQPGPSVSYRFRPLASKPQAQAEQPIRYGPLQMQIPERYVFRPLNPVSRPAPSMPVQPPPAAYPTSAYPWANGARSYNAFTPNRPGSYSPYMARPYATQPWAGAATAYRYRQPPGYSAWRGYQPIYAHSANRMPRFRPRYYPGWENAHSPVYGPRYVQRRPIRRYPPPAPAWRFVRTAPVMPYPGYSFSEQTAQRQPIPPARLNPYGTDWYDGRADGDGAWYRLAMEKSPAVSQTWESSTATGDKSR